MYLMQEVWSYLRIRKKWWLAPMIIIAMLFGLLILSTQGSVVAGFGCGREDRGILPAIGCG